MRRLTLVCVVFTLFPQVGMADPGVSLLASTVRAKWLTNLTFREKTLSQVLASRGQLALNDDVMTAIALPVVRAGEYDPAHSDLNMIVDRLAGKYPDVDWGAVKRFLAEGERVRRLQVKLSQGPSQSAADLLINGPRARAGRGREALDPLREKTFLLYQNERFAEESKRIAVKEVLETQDPPLYDSAGRRIEANDSQWSSAINEFQDKATTIIVEVLEGVPLPSRFKSAQVFKHALDEAFRKHSKGRYIYNRATGKLKLKYQTAGGRFHGEVNTCRVASGILILSGYCKLKELVDPPWLPPSQEGEGRDSAKLICKIGEDLERLCAEE